MKVLVVEDEKEIRELLVTQFKDCGVECIGLETGNEIIPCMEGFNPSVVLLDQMMPGKSGAEVVREIRTNAKFSETPIMMVTGLDGETEKVKALEIGADDYVTKPFSVREVIARAQALVRRSQVTHRASQKNLQFKDLALDLSAHKVYLRGSEVPLTLTEYKILAELVRCQGQVLTRDKLREKALGNLNVTDRTIDVHMASLRKKIDNMGDCVETVRGVGYRLV